MVQARYESAAKPATDSETYALIGGLHKITWMYVDQVLCYIPTFNLKSNVIYENGMEHGRLRQERARGAYRYIILLAWAING